MNIDQISSEEIARKCKGMLCYSVTSSVPCIINGYARQNIIFITPLLHPIMDDATISWWYRITIIDAIKQVLECKEYTSLIYRDQIGAIIKVLTGSQKDSIKFSRFDNID